MIEKPNDELLHIDDRVGVVCDGQLGRMMVESVQRDDRYLVQVLGEGGPNSPASQVGATQIDGKITDGRAVRLLTELSDVTTIEIEHGNNGALRLLRDEKGANVQPSPDSLVTIENKYLQHVHFESSGIATAPFNDLLWEEGLANFRKRHGRKAMVKQAYGGYDGRGNLLLNPDMEWSDVRAYFENDNSLPDLYIEKFIPFKRELSLVGIRDLAGNVAAYPVVETVHKQNICHVVFAEAEIDDRVREAAEHLGRAAIGSFEGAGVFAVEMYQTEDDEVLVNEIAPRVHNSGHWTDIGARTSQFEQHLRAILGMELGPMEMTAPAAVMVNLLGIRDVPIEADAVNALDFDGMRSMRWYGKTMPKADAKGNVKVRKVGHITALGEDHREALAIAKSALNQLNKPFGDDPAFMPVDVER